jgi:hypothetical protein
MSVGLEVLVDDSRILGGFETILGVNDFDGETEAGDEAFT